MLKSVNRNNNGLNQHTNYNGHHNSVLNSLDHQHLKIDQVIEWIRGPGHKLLLSQGALPTNFESAEKLRKDHEQFEFKCMKTLALYAELQEGNIIKRLQNQTGSNYKLDLANQIVGDFLKKLQARKAIVIACERFFKILNEIWVTHDNLISLCNASSQHFESKVEVQQRMDSLNHQHSTLQQRSVRLRNELSQVRAVIHAESVPGDDELTVRPALSSMETELAQIGIMLQDMHGRYSIKLLDLKRELHFVSCWEEAKNGLSNLSQLTHDLLLRYRQQCIGRTPVEAAQLLSEHHFTEKKVKECVTFTELALEAYSKMCDKLKRSNSRCAKLAKQLSIGVERFNVLSNEVRDRINTAEIVYQNIDSMLSRIEDLLLQMTNSLELGTPMSKIQKLSSNQREQLILEFRNLREAGFSLMIRITTRIANEQDLSDASELELTQSNLRMKLYTLFVKLQELDHYLGDKTSGSNRLQFEDANMMLRLQISKFLGRLKFHRQNWIREPGGDDAEYSSVHLIQQHDQARQEVEELWSQLKPLLVENQNTFGDSLRNCSVEMEQWLRDWARYRSRLVSQNDLLDRLASMSSQVNFMRGQLENSATMPLDEIASAQAALPPLMDLKKQAEDIEPDVLNILNECNRKLPQDQIYLVDQLSDSWSRLKHGLENLKLLIESILEIFVYLPRVERFLSQWSSYLHQSGVTIDQLHHLQSECSDHLRVMEGFDVQLLLRLSQELSCNQRRSQQLASHIKTLIEALNSARTAIQSEINERNEAHQSTKELKLERSIGSSRQSLEDVDDNEDLSGLLCDVICSLPDNTEIIENEGVQWHLQFCGFRRPPLVYWWHNRRPLNLPVLEWSQSISSRDVILSGQSLKSSHSGEYSCLITDRKRTVELRTSGNLMVHPSPTIAPSYSNHRPISPRIAAPIEDIEAREGCGVTLQCNFSGYHSRQQPDISWLKDGKRISFTRGDSCWRQTTVQEGSSLTADSIQKCDEGVYTCVFTDPSTGKVLQSSGRVTVVSSPCFVQELPSLEVYEDEPVFLQCQLTEPVDFSRSSNKVIWLRDDFVVSGGNILLRNDAESGTCNLQITAAQICHTGSYTCRVETLGGVVHSTTDLVVKPRDRADEEVIIPQVHTRARSVQSGESTREFISEGRESQLYSQYNISDKESIVVPKPTARRINLSMSSRSKTSPPSIVVQSPQSPSPTPEEATCHSDKRDTSEDFRAYSPIDEQEDEERVSTNYGTVVVNGSGVDSSMVSDTMKTSLVIDSNTLPRDPPTFVTVFGDQIAREGEMVSFSCEIEGIPPPVVWWTFNGKFLRSSRVEFQNDGPRFSLLIASCAPRDTGRYSITAENSSGVATCSALLIVNAWNSLSRKPNSSFANPRMARSLDRFHFRTAKSLTGDFGLTNSKFEDEDEEDLLSRDEETTSEAFHYKGRTRGRYGCDRSLGRIGNSHRSMHHASVNSMPDLMENMAVLTLYNDIVNDRGNNDDNEVDSCFPFISVNDHGEDEQSSFA